ncbi:hypothetical protein [Dorea sp. YH-dor228]|uniref:hypothetical protein n=1 Tax=Lachnospiraceae TaxID=186803 RepID=UPI0032426564
MSEEVNMVKEENIESKSDANKIVSIGNKSNSIEAEAQITADNSVNPVPGGDVDSAAAKESIAAERTESATSNESTTSHTTEQKASYEYDDFDDIDCDEDEKPHRHFFRSRARDVENTRDKLILSRIKDEDLMDYLKLEQQRLEFLQQAKEVKEKRLLIAFQLTISLAAIVAIVYLLKDNPMILISILYIVGIIAALNIWKNPRSKDKDKDK